jgi:hypothetical protein
MSVSINGTTGLITAGASSSGGGGVASNTALGGDALVANTTGANNTAIGNEALKTNTTSSDNTAVGYQAGYSNTTGTRLAALGRFAGYSNTTGNYNTALGTYALYSNATTSNNTAVGHNSLYFNVGNSNTSVGAESMIENIGGANNTALGYQALNKNTSASNNTAVGYQAGYSNTTGRLTALGYQAGYSNTTGDLNTFIGLNTGYSVTTGSNNTFIGSGGVSGVINSAGYAMTTGSKNTIIGNYTGNNSGLDIRTASNRIVLSDGDGNPRVTVNSSGVMFVGASFTDTAGSSQIVTNGPVTVGYPGNSALYRQMYQSSDNNFYFTNGTNQGYLSSAGAWTNASDARLKTNIRDIEYGLNTVLAMQPRHYERVDVNGTYVGFVAQELQTVIPEVVSGDPEKQLGIDYGSLVAVAFKAIQELNAKVEAQALEIATLKGQ